MAIANRTDLEKRIAFGDGFLGLMMTTNGVTFTAGNANSGWFGGQILANVIGSTMPGTMIGLPQPPSPPNELLLTHAGASNTSANFRGILARLYKFGTLALNATGDRFTHDSATFPAKRTVFGQANQPIPLIPLIQITTATTTTAAVMTLKTAAGGAGYKDTLGNSIVGTKTTTLPAAATAVGSTYIPRLENGDAGVTDVLAIQVNTAASAGAATVWGMEPLCFFNQMNAGGDDAQIPELVFGNGLWLPDIAPASPTSGSFTTLLAMLHFGSSMSANAQGHYAAVLNS